MSLARRQSAHSRLLAVLTALLATGYGGFGAFLAEPTEPPPETTREADEGASGPAIEETETVRRHLLDVSVLAPGGSSWRSEAGLPRDAFEILVDGEPLPEPRRSMMEFDEVCLSGQDGSPGKAQRGPVPTLLVLADLNYLDVGMRHATARALDELAAMMESATIRAKVLAYTRETVTLTPGFTSDPAEIRAASEKLLQTLSPPPPIKGGDGSLPGGPETSLGPGGEPRLAPEQADATDGREPAFQLIVPGSNGSDVLQLGSSPPASPRARLLSQAVDPRPSLAALESVMVSHAAIPGRKAVVLFTGGSFDLPEELWLSYVMRPLQAAQAGFVIWTVNAAGLSAGPGSSSRSSLLGHLAGATGGGRVRSAGRLAVAFERASEQLSCYYLFSIPIPEPGDRSERHTVTVSLDTDKYPELWTYKVRAPTSFVLLDERTRAERRRLAALMEPSGYSFPSVRVNPSYPSGLEEGMVAPIEISVRLSDLLFQRSPEGNSLARFAWEGVVTDETDRTVCRLGDGRVRRIAMDGSPLTIPSARLVLRTACRIPSAGRYEARAVVEDLHGDAVGAGRTGFRVFEPGEGIARISALRLGRNTGNDFLLDLARPDSVQVQRDQEQRAFVPLEAGESIRPGDQLMIRFVACRAADTPHVVLYSRNESPEGPRALYQLLVTSRGSTSHDSVECRELEAVLPGGSLDPGSYGVALFHHDVEARTRSDVEELLAGGRTAAAATFEVREARGADVPEQPDPA